MSDERNDERNNERNALKQAVAGRVLGYQCVNADGVSILEWREHEFSEPVGDWFAKRGFEVTTRRASAHTPFGKFLDPRSYQASAKAIKLDHVPANPSPIGLLEGSEVYADTVPQALMLLSLSVCDAKAEALQARENKCS